MKEIVYWNGHEMLGDAIGFCAAAHCFYKKTGQIVKIHFQESRKEIVNYFDGIEWVPKDHSKYEFIDCGLNPLISEFENINGVKRFYKYMDPTYQCPVSFDVHFNMPRKTNKNFIVGVISKANTCESFPIDVLQHTIETIKELKPRSKFVSIGMCDNTFVSKNVIDLRQKYDNIHKIINYISRISLLISPHTGPVYIAAGFNIPSIIYRTRGIIQGLNGSYWDKFLNFDNYKPLWI